MTRLSKEMACAKGPGRDGGGGPGKAGRGLKRLPAGIGRYLSQGCQGIGVCSAVMQPNEVSFNKTSKKRGVSSSAVATSAACCLASCGASPTAQAARTSPVDSWQLSDVKPHSCSWKFSWLHSKAWKTLATPKLGAAGWAGLCPPASRRSRGGGGEDAFLIPHPKSPSSFHEDEEAWEISQQGGGLWHGAAPLCSVGSAAGQNLF